MSTRGGILHRLLRNVEDTTGSDTPGADSCFNVNYDQIIYNVAAQNK